LIYTARSVCKRTEFERKSHAYGFEKTSAARLEHARPSKRRKRIEEKLKSRNPGDGRPEATLLAIEISAPADGARKKTGLYDGKNLSRTGPKKGRKGKISAYIQISNDYSEKVKSDKRILITQKAFISVLFSKRRVPRTV